jgi:hypothetical protein
MRPRTAYELSQSQVKTPEAVVALFWQLAGPYRRRFGTVLDMGAGDCRLARGAPVDKYIGVEIDKSRVRHAHPPKNGTLINGCVFKHKGTGYDACVGNPPYVRHHDIQSPWKENIVARIERELGICLNKHCNLYIYFLCLAILKSHDDGLVSLIIPYEWVSRPSTKAVRKFIREQRWNVTVYRFQTPIFDGVMTTASITIVDKASRNGEWNYYDIKPDYSTIKRRTVTGGRYNALEYSNRGLIWGLRGLSPGSQEIFTLTEGQRVHFGLSKRDVVPCVTSLRHAPPELRVLSKASFRKYYVLSGAKCWLIRSFSQKRSSALDAYLNAVPFKKRQTYTCKNQLPWFKFRPHPIPQLLFSSGFTTFGPKVLLNGVGARTVGSVWGIHSSTKLPRRKLQEYLLNINFEKRVVGHAEKLKKVEVRQLNGVLNSFIDGN